MDTELTEEERIGSKRYHLFYKLEAALEAPMFILSVLWLVFLIMELTKGLTATQELLVVIIWGLFILEFLVKFIIAPQRWQYIKSNWLTIIALLIPAFRVFRLVQAIRILQFSRVTTSTYFVRALTSGSRFLREVKEAQGPEPEPEMNVGIMLALNRAADTAGMEAYVRQLSLDAGQEMETGTGIKWNFHLAEPVTLETGTPRGPSQFLDEASMRMAEGPFDLVVVVTDVALLSRKNKAEPGLASQVSRVLVISTRNLVRSQRGEPRRALDAEDVRWNGAALLLHLLGHISGLRRKDRNESEVMAPYMFKEGRRSVPHLNAAERKALRRRSERLPERELHGGNMAEGLIFHILMAFRHPMEVAVPLLRNWALLLPLSLPGLATAAVAPSFLLIFTAEIWDVGLNMPNQIVVLYAVISILGATFYLVRVQSLFLPRKDKRILTEHLAVANTVIFLSMLLACIGLFIIVGGLMYLIETYIFPEGLMKTWPTLLDQPDIDWRAKLRLAAFISTVGVTTGALAGGLESRTVIQHLALFRDKP